MTVLETSLTDASARISVDGEEYLVMGDSRSVTVIAGRYWIDSRRAAGRTFWSIASLIAHYRRHGNVLAEYAQKFGMA